MVYSEPDLCQYTRLWPSVDVSDTQRVERLRARYGECWHPEGRLETNKRTAYSLYGSGSARYRVVIHKSFHDLYKNVFFQYVKR
jgi:hypothetical protein